MAVPGKLSRICRSGVTSLTSRSRASMRFERINPLVQVVGDAAVLTFNYASYGRSGAPSRWNCTEVFRRTDDAWRIIQTHWSYTLAKRA